MRQGRLKVSKDQPFGYYHCYSKVIEDRHIFDDSESELFSSVMRRVEAYCEVRVLTHSLMGNHFHLFTQVPKRPDVLPSPKAIVEKVRRYRGDKQADRLDRTFQRLERNQQTAELQALLERFYQQFWDISQFMKRLKQDFTRSFNDRHKRGGPLWKDRFGSGIIEGSAQVMMMVATYIDLNSVRAFRHKDPKDHRWSGYGEAEAGVLKAREGIQFLIQESVRKEVSIEEAVRLYRMQLYRVGDEQREWRDANGETKRGCLRHQDVIEVLENKGKLPRLDYVRCRVRYLSHGAILGSKAFVEEVARENGPRLKMKRKERAFRMQGLEEEVYSWKDWKKKLFG